ncbi:MAG: T9SS type A sorting domain-containing protein, partial [Calditrichaceae bacterium]|nr:T9SS type A sorting domain-containing protein [Calditrichaceae bacterium]
TIRYGLKQSCNVKITIYNSLGRKIIELINERQDAGYHQAIWNGKNYLNQQVSSGIYFYRLSTENFTAIKRMVFIK